MIKHYLYIEEQFKRKHNTVMFGKILLYSSFELSFYKVAIPYACITKTRSTCGTEIRCHLSQQPYQILQYCIYGVSRKYLIDACAAVILSN